MRTGRRVSGKRDSALQTRKFLFFWQAFFGAFLWGRINTGLLRIDHLPETDVRFRCFGCGRKAALRYKLTLQIRW